MIKISLQEAKAAIRTLLLWIGENPDREGLSETPSRVLNSYKHYFSGYQEDPKKILRTTFSESDGYSNLISLYNIEVQSYCEHHLAPIIGKAHVGYIPDGKVVGISKIGRLVEVFSKRLQLQERMTMQIASALYNHLQAKGVIVVIEAQHFCISNRGIEHPNTIMYTNNIQGDIDDCIFNNFIKNKPI